MLIMVEFQYTITNIHECWISFRCRSNRNIINYFTEIQSNEVFGIKNRYVKITECLLFAYPMRLYRLLNQF